MNILFEGVNGSGKTTLINEFRKVLEEKNIPFNYISDLETDTPLNPVLKQMFSESVFLQMGNHFKTSLFESLVLAADHHYIQEMHRNDKGITLYDRDFISVLAYQKDIIKQDYPEDWEDFYSAFRKIMLYHLKKIDILCYVSVSTEENIKRTELRDNRLFSEEEKKTLYALKTNMEEEITSYCAKHKVLLLRLDGRENATENVKKIIAGIKQLHKNKSPKVDETDKGKDMEL